MPVSDSLAAQVPAASASWLSWKKRLMAESDDAGRARETDLAAVSLDQLTWAS